jgi:CRP-like cAMP-binding protein
MLRGRVGEAPLVASAVGPRAQLLSRGERGRFAAQQSLPRATERILDGIRLTARTLEEHPGLTSVELAERVGYGRRHMSLLLLRLEEGGHVVHDGRRWFPGPESVG